MEKLKIAVLLIFILILSGEKFMVTRAVLFDLDGTLLPMDRDVFAELIEFLKKFKTKEIHL